MTQRMTRDEYAQTTRRWLALHGVPTLSLTQPWATLLVTGEKAIETRSWGTRYHGPLLIHASKTFGRADAALVDESPFTNALATHGVTRAAQLPLGALLGLVWLTGCHPARVAPTAREQAFGFFGPGRTGWHVTAPEPFTTPSPARGARGVWYCFDPVMIDRAVEYAVRQYAQRTQEGSR